MIKERITLRINDNLKARIMILSVENRISINKMITYLLELGYSEYMNKFNNYYKGDVNKEVKKIDAY